MSLSDFRVCTYRLSHLGEEKMVLFSAFQALLVGLQSATVVVKSEQWYKISWKNRFPSGILPLEVVNGVLLRVGD